MVRTFVICAFLVLICNELAYSQKRGVQLRLTSKGFNYAMQISLNLFQKDTNGKKLRDHNGNKGGLKYKITDIQINRMNIGSGSYLKPTAGSTLDAKVSQISLRVTAKIKYEKKVGWFKIRDSVDVNAAASGVSFTMSLKIGKRSDGRPSLATASCNSVVGHLRLRFSGSKASWLYNLLSHVIEDKLRDEISDAMCDGARKAIQERGDTELRTFPVKKVVDKWAILDYSMTADPLFTDKYMDVFLKGEFKSRSNPKESLLPMPSFSTSKDLSKMVYFWITDYNINTAGEVYHNSGSLQFTARSNDTKMNNILRNTLHTKRFKYLIPELFRKFPNRPMSLRIHSYKAPSVSIKPGSLKMNIYAAVTFQVVPNSGAVIDVFSILMDITIGMRLFIEQGKVKGHLDPSYYKLNLKQGKSTVGPIRISLNTPFVKSIVQRLVVKSIQPLLKKGIPLPNLGNVDLIKPDITLMQGVIRIGADCKFMPKKMN